MKEKVQFVLKNLEKRKIKANYFETREEAKNAVLNEIHPNLIVGIGGSMTIMEMKLHEGLMESGNTVYWHWLVEPEKRGEIREKACRADIYLTSTNAITEHGELVNIDGVGNRVGAMFYGPKKVIVVCGINKICRDLASAIDRIKKEACPKNAVRLGLKTPCAITGQCSECLHEQRMCNITTIIHHKPMAMDLSVYIVGESLGY